MNAAYILPFAVRMYELEVLVLYGSTKGKLNYVYTDIYRYNVDSKTVSFKRHTDVIVPVDGSMKAMVFYEEQMHFEVLNRK